MARLANALVTLRAQVDEAHPGRAKFNDGWIGDAAHQARKSDHNPNAAGVVQAIDLSHDQARGFDSYAFADLLRQKRDNRIKYVISHGRIFSSSVNAWEWRPYVGADDHSHHVHISASDDPHLYDDARQWDIDAGSVAPPVDPPVSPPLHTHDEGAPSTNRYPLCLPFILQAEGGNDDDPNDPGGRTSRGIIQREYNAYRAAKGEPTRDVWTATDAEVSDIYEHKYWLPLCPTMPAGVDLIYFDVAVNAGPGQAAKQLQRALGVTADGAIGPITLAALKAANPADLIPKFSDVRRGFYRALAQFPRYGRGWLARVDMIEAAAKKMVIA